MCAGAWALLSQLWEEQMKRSPNDYKVVENIGNICLKNGKSGMYRVLCDFIGFEQRCT